MKECIILIVALNVAVSGFLLGQQQYKSKYPDIPIVDVHVHATGVEDASNYIKVSRDIKERYGSNLAFFVGLSVLTDPVAEVMVAGDNRFLFAVSEMRPHKGLTYTPEEVVARVRDGFTGMKFWFGDPRRVIKEGEESITRIDDPGFEELFSTLERGNVLMTSLHIADPNGPFGDRQPWMTDPVYYWTQIRAFENVVAKYPKLTIVAAHGAWLVCQDAQIDYLRYMLATYPNLYIELSATYQYLPLLDYENLRDFIFEYQDRILFGSDFSRFNEDAIQGIADRFAVIFEILETDQMVNGKFRSDKIMKGLDLPREILEKIYYKNALKLYPGLKELMNL